MNPIIPPKVTIVAHVNWRTNRLTGRTLTLPAGQALPPNEHPGEWVVLDVHSAMHLMNGRSPWHEWIRLGSKVVHMPDYLYNDAMWQAVLTAKIEEITGESESVVIRKTYLIFRLS